LITPKFPLYIRKRRENQPPLFYSIYQHEKHLLGTAVQNGFQRSQFKLPFIQQQLHNHYYYFLYIFIKVQENTFTIVTRVKYLFIFQIQKKNNINYFQTLGYKERKFSHLFLGKRIICLFLLPLLHGWKTGKQFLFTSVKSLYVNSRATLYG